MTIWRQLKLLLSPSPHKLDELFSLGDRQQPGIPGARHADIWPGSEEDPYRDPPTVEQSEAQQQQQSEEQAEQPQPEKADFVRPKRVAAVVAAQEKADADAAAAEPARLNPKKDRVPAEQAAQERYLQRLFHLPQNKDVIIRRFEVALPEPVPALAVFTEGLVNAAIVGDHILLPLMRLVQLTEPVPTSSDSPDSSDPALTIELVKRRLLPGPQPVYCQTMQEVAQHVLAGDTVILLAGCDTALAVETKGWEERGVGEPKTELTVAGPHDAFNENVRTNTAMIRRRLRTPDLVTEMYTVGELSNDDVALMYIHGVTNPKLVAEVRRRLRAVKTDMLTDTGMLQQFLEDSPSSFVPTGIRTERPDRAAAFLAEGAVVLLVNTSPLAYVVPVSIWSMIHTPEDAYLRWPHGTFLRWLRFTAMFVTLLVPAGYVAVTNYHPEMIPTDLLLAIAASRERVPLPVVLEVLLMEGSFELIREAGIRVPSVIGPTIGIVGALILGQAAVAASIISPLLVIIVAITGLASFAIPNYGLSFALRLLRFPFILLGATTGFFGIAIGLSFLIIHLVSLRSFGVPFFSPVAPSRHGSEDIMMRYQSFRHERRPSYLRPVKRRRQPRYVRTWDPLLPKPPHSQAAEADEKEIGKRE